jgi:Tfp pilus assembly protein FimT
VPVGTENRRAFTLAELILIVVILGVFAAIAVPRLDYGIVKRYKAEATAKKIVTDLRRVRGLATANAANNTNGFALRMLGPDPYTGYEIVNLDTAATIDSHSIDSAVTVASAASQFDFGPFGNLTSTNTQLTVSADGKIFTIGFVTATGTVTCAEN